MATKPGADMTPRTYIRGPYKPRKVQPLVRYWIRLPADVVARLSLLSASQQRALIATLKLPKLP